MKSNYKIILGMVIAMALTVVLPCRAVDGEQESVWAEDEPNGGIERMELSDEVVEQIMGRLSERDPEKAERLSKLREEDPEKFRVELRKLMRRKFMREFRNRRKYGPKKRRHYGKDKFGKAEMPGMPGRRHRMMRERHDEYLKWLEGNYPEEAEKLAELHEKNPELYRRHVALSLKKYGRIAEAAKENPALAEVLKENLELTKKQYELVKKIEVSSDNKKKALTKKLEAVVGDKFDLIVKRRQMAYEQMLKKLEELKEEVRKSEAQVEKWKDVKFKNESVKTRVEELIAETTKFRWE